MASPRHPKSLFTLCVALVCLCGADVFAAENVELSAAGTAEHLWFVQTARKDGSGFELCHHSPRLGGPYYRVQAALSQPPEAMAATGNRVWLVFPPRDEAGLGAREVFTVQVHFNPAFESFYVEPADRLESVAPLPGPGRLASLVGCGNGPVALLWPSPRSAPSERDAESAAPRILKLAGNQWEDVPLPDIGADRSALLATAGSDGSHLVLLASASNARQILRSDLGANDEWVRSAIDLDLRRIAGLARLDSQVVAAISDDSAGGWLIAYLRTAAYLPVAIIAKPPKRAWLVPVEGDVGILQEIGPRKFSLVRVRQSDGSVDSPQELVEQPMSAARAWQMGLILAVIVTSILLLFVVKPLIAPNAPLPRGVVLLSPMRRLTALAIDLLPGAAVAIVLLRCSPAELLTAPMMTFEAVAIAPNLTVMAATAVMCAVTEMIWSTTPGKWLMGGRIETTQQRRPGSLQVLARNAVKFLVLVVPPIGLVVLLNPHMQGLQDVAGRTLVVVRAAAPASDDARETE